MIDEKPEKITEIIEMIQTAIGKENIYLEVIAQDEKLLPQLGKINHQVIQIAENMGTKCVTDNNFHYTNKQDKEPREIALAIKDGKKIYDEDRRKPKGDFYIMSEEEIREKLKGNDYSQLQIDEWVSNNEKIAESINTKINLNQTLFPNYDAPDDIREIYEGFKDKLVEKD